jgi:hypothetical protein
MVQAIAPAGSLSNFPFMTSPEFCDAAEALCRRVHAVGGPHKLDWWSVRLQQEVREYYIHWEMRLRRG